MGDEWSDLLMNGSPSLFFHSDSEGKGLHQADHVWNRTTKAEVHVSHQFDKINKVSSRQTKATIKSSCGVRRGVTLVEWWVQRVLVGMQTNWREALLSWSSSLAKDAAAIAPMMMLMFLGFVRCGEISQTEVCCSLIFNLSCTGLPTAPFGGFYNKS